MIVHCQEYYELTIEEKLLVDKEMEPIDKANVPSDIFKWAEEITIAKLKEKNV